MNHTENLTRYIAGFVDELSASGVEHAVISPGSRSTPLALTLSEHEKINQWVLVDERSAAFFALGLAKAKQQPVVLVCTSGTAAANYFPAIVEAYYSKVPLIVLTADRPHELRDVDAPQAIEQVKMYGDYVKWFHEMALPDATQGMLAYARSKAARAVLAASAFEGPVHLNFPLREPLVPDFSLEDLWGIGSEIAYYEAIEGKRQLADDQVEALKRVWTHGNGLIVIGPEQDTRTAAAVLQLGQALGLPVLADPLSQLRSGNDRDHVVACYDAILRTEEMRTRLKPDFIIRFGAMPVSKMYRFYIEQHADVPQYIVSANPHFREPVGNRTHFVHADPQTLGTVFAKARSSVPDGNWLSLWQELEQCVSSMFDAKTGELTEGSAVQQLIEHIPEHSTLFSGNSMAIRDLDTFYTGSEKALHVMANRGANGIDGVVSAAAGAAAAGSRTTLLIGDLSFYHDMNGLFAAKHYALPLTVVLVNNGGGGIFSFLPQSKNGKHFESLFGTPLDMDFRHAAALYGADYVLTANEAELGSALDASYGREGLSIIEVQTDRAENERWHRDKWASVNDALFRLVSRYDA